MRSIIGRALCALLLLATEEPAHATGLSVNGRPFHVRLPPGYSPGVPAPLIILLHGIGASGSSQDMYMQIGDVAADRGMIFVLPDGTRSGIGMQYWNGAGCCQVTGTPVDDVGYIAMIIDEVGRRFSVDPKRIFVVGHSNGGFMTHRFACEKVQAAAIVTLAGMVNPKSAGPYGGPCPAEGRPVSVLHVHGTADNLVYYNGLLATSPPLPGGLLFPSAVQTVEFWAKRNRCAIPARTERALPDLDIEAKIPGPDTTRIRYAGCPAGGAVELWTINQPWHDLPTNELRAHVPTFYRYPDAGETFAWTGRPVDAGLYSPDRAFAKLVVDWLMAHPKP